MKDEIEDILEDILEGIEETSKEQFVPIDFSLTIKECKTLLDYITNLQEIADNRMDTILEIEKYCNDEKEDLISGGEVCEDVIKIIDKLKNKIVLRHHPFTKRKIEELQKEIEILRSNYIGEKLKIDRAKQYIEKHRIREKSIVDVDVLEGILNE